MRKASCIRLSFLSREWGRCRLLTAGSFKVHPSFFSALSNPRDKLPFSLNLRLHSDLNLHRAHSSQRWQAKLPPASGTRHQTPDSAILKPWTAPQTLTAEAFFSSHITKPTLYFLHVRSTTGHVFV